MIRKLIPQTIINIGKHLPEAIVANIKYGFPGKKLKVIGVKGTDGKTTTVNMIYKILKEAEKKVSMVSTINAEVAGKSYDTGFHVTSPRSSLIQHFLFDSVKNGDEFFVLEVTSHALDQFRVLGIPFEVGVITNVTHEHLDYHQNFANYLQAKSKLISNSKYAILNADDPSFKKLQNQTTGKVISFGEQTNADVNPSNLSLRLNIPGDYNILNALAAAAVAKIFDINEAKIKHSLESFVSLPGRMEKVENNKGLTIVVDFAHTPNALEKALLTLKKQTKGKLISVFGCASERDTEKRPIMGQISTDLADITILTDEDPRFEDSLKIISEIADGKEGFIKEPNRKEAIELAISLAKKGDTIGIFGKGHERSMSYQGCEISWSDTDTVRKALKN